MTQQSSKKLSRRDALKLLGAATGAAALANLPSKWSTPELSRGVLPAHAQTSGPVLYSISCNAVPTSGVAGVVEFLEATVTSAQSASVENIQVQVHIVPTNPAGATTLHATGFTIATGLVTFPDVFCPFNQEQDYNLVFSFVDQATYGPATCTLGEYNFNGC